LLEVNLSFSRGVAR